MKKVLRWFLPCLMFSFTATGQLRPRLLLLPGEASSTQRELLWSTDPGIRYELQFSTNLADWSVVDGFPAVAGSLAQQHMLELQNSRKGFFRVLVLDEQPPEIVSRIPADGSFGVRRFSSIKVTLQDATAIDAGSINLTLGTHGTFSVNSSQMYWSTNSLVVDLGGNTALGGYGETVDVALAVSDTLGNSTNYMWQFELEQESEEAENIFVFGSPDAQRSGQRLSGMASVLAARFGGPVRMSNSGQEWEISTVTTNTIVLAYTGDSAPAFAAGQLLANLAPKHVSEIFYRRITALSNDPGEKNLTLHTADVGLPDLIVSGSFSISDDAVLLDMDTEGNLVRALALDATLQLPTAGADFSNTTLYSDGPIKLTLSEGKFLFTPKLKIALHTEGKTVQRFEAQLSGDIECSCVPSQKQPVPIKTALSVNCGSIVSGFGQRWVLCRLASKSNPLLLQKQT
ncbi:MAG: Ig-like domain-containing protein [Kiritimatiellales bacterium]